MEIRYVGAVPVEGLHIAEADVFAERNKWIEVDPDLGKRLLEQNTNEERWESRQQASARQAAKKARRTRKAPKRTAAIEPAPAPEPEPTDVTETTVPPVADAEQEA